MIAGAGRVCLVVLALMLGATAGRNAATNHNAAMWGEVTASQVMRGVKSSLNPN